MKSQYEYTTRMGELCHLLEDKQSKDIFWARLQCDCDDSLENVSRLYELTGIATAEELRVLRELNSICDKVKAEGKKLFLYGASAAGLTLGKLILQSGSDFYAYCARNHEKYVNGVNGKRVFPPSYVFAHPEECCVLSAVATPGSASAIYRKLNEHHFPKDQIFAIVRADTAEELEKQQYFAFPEYFPKGKAFVDAGCFDCGTSIRFAEWSGGAYTKIYAFEPDPKNYQRCKAIADSSNLRLELLPFGLSDQEETVCFAADGSLGSTIIRDQESQNFSSHQFAPESMIQIQTVALDKVVPYGEVGFIKMDIEGSELAALRGAEQTLVRDKPFLAICVYHRTGDVLAIMDHLHELVPEYRFWLRQYGVMGNDTILYASSLK